MKIQGISERAMGELAGVNSAFVGLAAMSEQEDTGGIGLSRTIVRRLSLLDDASRRRLGFHPFSLFTLNFQDVPGWSALLEQRVRDGEEVLYWPDDGSRLYQFLVMALAAVRELAEREPLSASVLFGIPSPLVPKLGETDIGALPAVATAIKPWLRARCSNREDWWDRMILASCSDEADRADRYRGVHASLMRALNLEEPRAKGGRLYRRS